MNRDQLVKTQNKKELERRKARKQSNPTFQIKKGLKPDSCHYCKVFVPDWSWQLHQGKTVTCERCNFIKEQTK